MGRQLTALVPLVLLLGGAACGGTSRSYSFRLGRRKADHAAPRLLPKHHPHDPNRRQGERDLPPRSRRTSSRPRRSTQARPPSKPLLSVALGAEGRIGPNPAINAFVKSNGEAIRIISGATSIERRSS